MRTLNSAALAAATAFAAAPALAHHVTGANVPVTAVAGLLSGLGHPVIGIDHLAFTVAAGVAAAAAAAAAGRALMPLVFVAATVAGCLLRTAGIALPAAEAAVAASVVIAGVLIMARQVPPTPALAGLFALAGAFHGWAYGNGIVGAEATPLLAYLAGFAMIQYAIAVIAALAAPPLWQAARAGALRPRLAGAVVAGVGLAVVVDTIGARLPA